MTVLVLAIAMAASPQLAKASFQSNEQELESLLGGGVPAGQMPSAQTGPSGGDLSQPARPGSLGAPSQRGVQPGRPPSTTPPKAISTRHTGKATRRCYRVGPKRWVCRFGLFIPCPMNGGSSGGPWFRYYNGQWVIAGVNNQCSPGTTDTCSPYGTWLISSLMNSNFEAFWNGVAAQLSSA